MTQATGATPKERDPRVDPKEYDIVRIGTRYGGAFYEVLPHDPRLASQDVSYARDGKEHALSIHSWRSIMKDAEVIHVSK